MDRFIAKIVSLVVTFVVIFFCMALPIKVSQYVNKQKNAELILSLLRCMASGVFIGTIFTHMIPEVNHLLEHGLYNHSDIDYPVGEVIILAGFFLICFFEKTVLIVHDKRKKQKTPPPRDGVVNQGYDLGKVESDLTTDKSTPITTDPTTSDANEISKKRSLVLVLALAFECVFDGLGIGTQRTTSGTWLMCHGVLSHEFIIAFCLGTELVKHYSTKKVLLTAFGYALIPAVGITIGIIITENPGLKVEDDTLDLISGILIAIAAGIFLSCTFLGMLGEELIENCTYKKLLATVGGCAIMVCLAVIPHHDSADGDDDVISTTVATTTEVDFTESLMGW